MIQRQICHIPIFSFLEKFVKGELAKLLFMIDMSLSLIIIVKQKILVALTLYLYGNSSKHEVYYNHVYQKGLIIQIHL